MTALLSFNSPNPRRRPRPRLPSSSVFQIDASSYPGSGQTWPNMWKRPADGLAQADYDFWLGRNRNSGTEEPAFPLIIILEGGNFPT